MMKWEVGNFCDKTKLDFKGFELDLIEDILRFSEERYFDTLTMRYVVIGRYQKSIIMIPYEKNENLLIPITVHTITRQQIKFRIKTGRLYRE